MAIVAERAQFTLPRQSSLKTKELIICMGFSEEASIDRV